MRKPISPVRKNQFVENSLINVLSVNQNKTSLIEIKRKIRELQYRHDRLEAELTAVNSALISLNEEFTLNESSHQLTIYD